MKIIFALTLLLVLLLVGCTSDTAFENMNELSPEAMRQVSELFSEENWDQMEILFEEIRDDLLIFINYLTEHDLFDTLNGVRVSYHDDEESAMQAIDRASSRYSVIIYDNEMISAEMLWTWGPAKTVEEDDELVNIIMRIGELGVIESVTLRRRDGDVRVSFRINQGHPLAENIRIIVGNSFHYTDGDTFDTLWWRREIEEGWYMEIEPPPHW